MTAKPPPGCSWSTAQGAGSQRAGKTPQHPPGDWGWKGQLRAPSSASPSVGSHPASSTKPTVQDVQEETGQQPVGRFTGACLTSPRIQNGGRAGFDPSGGPHPTRTNFFWCDTGASPQPECPLS